MGVVTRARQALVLTGVVIAAAVVLGWTTWVSYDRQGGDALPALIDPAQTPTAHGATWGPADVGDLTGLRDPDDPLPTGARVLEAVVPYAPTDGELTCRIEFLAEAPSRAVIEHRPGAVAPRSWSPEVGAIFDEVERSESCAADSSAPGELRALFLVPGDISDDLLVAVDITGDDGREQLRFVVDGPS